MSAPASTQSPAAANEPITLNNIGPAKGAVKKADRVGRGRASGSGKTCNRGHNGQGQRSGRSAKRGFEGGQMPGYRRIPKVDGFRLVNPRKWFELNLGDLSGALLPKETELTPEMLLERGLMRRTHDGVRLLGKGECAKGLTVHVHHITAGARKKLEAAGGKVELIGLPQKADPKKA